MTKNKSLLSYTHVYFFTHMCNNTNMKLISYLNVIFSEKKINSESIEEIINACMIFTLNFDLCSPNFNDVRLVSVHHLLTMSMNQKIKTSKRLGYQLSNHEK